MRAACFVYAALIVYASLHPFAGWQQLGVSPLAWTTAPWPRWITPFDVASNIVAYAPLGALAVLALSPRWRVRSAVLIATFGCGLLSAVLESAQTWLPHRVASNVDFIDNLAGAAIGAIAVAPFVARLLGDTRLRDLRRRWFAPEASRGLILIALWLAAQLYPQAMLFGIGRFLEPLIDTIEALAGADHLEADSFVLFAPRDAALAETACSAAALAGACLLLLLQIRRDGPRMALLVAFIAAALVTRSFANAVAFGFDNLASWATPGARLGVSTGVLLILAASYAPDRVQRLFAIGLLAGSLLIVNLMPENPYFSATLAGWWQGPWINLNGLLQLLGAWWPVIALVHLSRGRKAHPTRMAGSS